MKTLNAEGQTFEQWLSLLDNHFTRIFLLSHDDFEDYDWWSEFNSNNTPEESFDEWYSQNVSELVHLHRCRGVRNSHG